MLLVKEIRLKISGILTKFNASMNKNCHFWVKMGSKINLNLTYNGNFVHFIQKKFTKKHVIFLWISNLNELKKIYLSGVLFHSTC